MQDAELPKLNKLKEEIKQSFTKYHKCMWYIKLIDTIEVVKSRLTEDVNNTPPFMIKYIYSTELQNYINQINVLHKALLLKYEQLINRKQENQLVELANLYKRVYNTMNTF